jgi:hypothetical protein
MNWIELYVGEVGKRLPLKGRKDIEAELRSTLEDMLEDRARKAGHEADEEMTLELLREYGPPDKVAGTYHPNQYLIGPRVYPFFIKVLKIVLTVLTIVLLVTLGLQLARQPAGPELAQAIVNGLVGIVSAAIAALGNIVLVFAILERVLPASEFKFDEDKKTWDPADLRKAAEPTELKPWEPIAAIVFTAAAIVIFNAYPHLIGTIYVEDGRWISISALTDAFFRWLPYMNVLWVLQIALNVVLLRQGHWQLATRLASIVLDAASIVIAYVLLIGPPIVNFSAEAMAATGLTDPGTAAALNATLQQAVRLVIVIVMIVQGVDVVKEIVKLLLRRR